MILLNWGGYCKWIAGGLDRKKTGPRIPENELDQPATVKQAFYPLPFITPDRQQSEYALGIPTHQSQQISKPALHRDRFLSHQPGTDYYR